MLTLETVVLTLVAVAALSLATILFAGRFKRLSGLALLALPGSLGALFYLDDAFVADRGAQTIRSYFHLPEDVEIGRLQRSPHKTPVCYRAYTRYQASVEFTEAQVERFVASTHQPPIWQPILTEHFGAKASEFVFADNAFEWRELPAPRFLGKQQLVWRVAGRDVRRGWSSCQEIRPLDEVGQAGGAIRYSVTGCDARRRDNSPKGGGHIEAAIDTDARRLNVTVYLGSKAAYCRNRMKTSLRRVLGLEPRS